MNAEARTNMAVRHLEELRREAVLDRELEHEEELRQSAEDRDEMRKECEADPFYGIGIESPGKRRALRHAGELAQERADADPDGTADSDAIDEIFGSPSPPVSASDRSMGFGGDEDQMF